MKKIIYLSYPPLDYPLNVVTIKGLRQNGVEVVGFHVKNKRIPGLIEVWNFYKCNSKNSYAVFVGYDSPTLIVFLKLFCHKKIIYNAVLSVYERMIISRKLASKFSIKAFYYWLIDFLAVHFADMTFVETEHQADFFKKIFKVSRKKVARSWIGLDNDKFYYDPAIPKLPVFTVVFRGAFLPETGVEYVVKAAKILEKEGVNFIINGGGMLSGRIDKLINELQPKNLELNLEIIPIEKLRGLMQKCHISLGQLSDHPRLDRTIPHKAYESLALKLPYLTASNTGILELLKEGETCITCKPADAKSLADKILWVKNNYSIAEKIAENGYKLYQNKLTSDIIAKNMLDKLKI